MKKNYLNPLTTEFVIKGERLMSHEGTSGNYRTPLNPVQQRRIGTMYI